MNQSDVRTHQTVHGHVAEFRLAWKSGFEPVVRIGEDGRRLGIEYFPSAKDAELAAWRTMNRIEQTAMVRGGVTVSQSRADADSFFKARPVEGDGKAVMG